MYLSLTLDKQARVSILKKEGFAGRGKHTRHAFVKHGR